MKRLITLLSLIGIVLTLVGLGISIYLTITHYNTSVTIACAESGIVNCAKVTSSSYSVLFGIPLPILGLIFFIVMLPLQLPQLWRSQLWWIRLGRLAFAATGIPFILYLIYIELYKLNAICLYCTGVHAITVLLFAQVAIGTALLREHEAKAEPQA